MFYMKEKQAIPQFVLLDMKSLNEQIEGDKQLKDLLSTPAKKLPEQYKYLIKESWCQWEDVTLNDVILAANFRLPKGQKLAIMLDNKIIGWCSFNTMLDVKLHSFYAHNIQVFLFSNNTSNNILSEYFEYFINIILNNLHAVSWSAMKDNPMNKFYKIIIRKYHGTKRIYKDKVYYYINK